MSQVVGIIAEYNPFHNGHAYHIAATKKQTGARECSCSDIRKLCTKRKYFYCG